LIFSTQIKFSRKKRQGRELFSNNRYLLSLLTNKKAFANFAPFAAKAAALSYYTALHTRYNYNKILCDPCAFALKINAAAYISGKLSDNHALSHASYRYR
jgi:hypothetical protein